MELEGTSAVVTGGASGLGESAARALVDRGASVVIVDRDTDKGAALAEEIGVTFAECDVTDEAAVGAAVAQAAAAGPLRSLVNSAGIGLPGRVVGRDGEPLALDVFETVIRVNLIGTFNVLRLAAAAMAKTEPYNDDGARGSIVNFASAAAFDGQIGQASYSASKGAVVGMTLPIGRDLASVGVRVNAVAPGIIDTPIFGPSVEAQDLKQRLGRDILFPSRIGRPEELTDVVLMLLTNDYMNCEVIRVDGGVRMPPRSG